MEGVTRVEGMSTCPCSSNNHQPPSSYAPRIVWSTICSSSAVNEMGVLFKPPVGP